MILVTGASGNVGSEVVKELFNRNIEFRSGVSNPLKLHSSLNPVKFNFEDSNTFNNALKNIDKIFLIRPPHISNIKKVFTPFLEEVKRHGIKHIVFLSVEGVDENKVVPHYKIEMEILRLNFNYTFLRAGFFMQNMSTTHKDEIKNFSEISLPVGNSKTAFIDTRDVGLAATICLLNNVHLNKKYTLTGKESISYNDVASILSKTLKKNIKFNDISYFSFFLKNYRTSKSFLYALIVTMLYRNVKLGNSKNISNDILGIINKDPFTFEEFAEEYKNVWL